MSIIITLAKTLSKITYLYVIHNSSYYTALQQNRQNVAPSTHATTHILSKPPARPAPPSVGTLIVLNVVFYGPCLLFSGASLFYCL